MLERILRSSRFEPSRLELEITEGVLIQEPGSCLEGSEWPSGARRSNSAGRFRGRIFQPQPLSRIPFRQDQDGSFICGRMLDSRQTRSIVQAMVSLARGPDLQVVAERSRDP